MSYQRLSRPKALRFVRWSRRSYAVFHSIGREVSIGTLRGNVVERIAPKTLALLPYIADADVLDNSDTPADDGEALLILQELLYSWAQAQDSQAAPYCVAT